MSKSNASESTAVAEKPKRHREASQYFIVSVRDDGSMVDATATPENPKGADFSDTAAAKSYIRDKGMQGTFRIMALKATVTAKKTMVEKTIFE